jgi:protein-S-isoprenylcysteine O-methyltransferase Ste14
MTLVFLLLASVPVTAGALWNARREYRRHGKLTLFGLAGLCAMILVPNLMLEYATSYQWPESALDFAGVLVGVGGLVLCLASVHVFRSTRKTLCLDAGELTVGGPYRWSRNPQYVGWFLFLLGFALTDWSLWCLAALGVSAVGLHLLVLVEEEHLRRVVGAPYEELCRRSPRYVGWGSLRFRR